ncbi:hypothetical protein BZG36_04219 [Bifiguratus adelaidae]|uniref:PRA1 family protein n=1 Tax=Bifiguratus adelaidae TaxID=1938954 RepID=A0A261XYB6_9FUNG|nr:hypothetical protein BZG36_04219 [Bifiguratus adelaidae]
MVDVLSPTPSLRRPVPIKRRSFKQALYNRLQNRLTTEQYEGHEEAADGASHFLLSKPIKIYGHFRRLALPPTSLLISDFQYVLITLTRSYLPTICQILITSLLATPLSFILGCLAVYASLVETKPGMAVRQWVAVRAPVRLNKKSAAAFIISTVELVFLLLLYTFSLFVVILMLFCLVLQPVWYH